MFREANLQRLTLFNSDNSYRLLEIYNNSVDNRIQLNRSHMPSKTFAPSSLRCKRRSWFRLRGVAPDSIDSIDQELQFAADIGTACHELIQQDLKSALAEDWIDVSYYLTTHPTKSSETTVELTSDTYITERNGLETFVKFRNFPINFSVDGLIKLKDTYCLLEIKTVPFSVWDNLTDPKDEHIDQVKCYCTMLNLDKCIMMYQDRQYGKMKCYEVDVTYSDKKQVLDSMKNVLQCVDFNIAPKGLEAGDKWCSPNYCPYYKKCKEY